MIEFDDLKNGMEVWYCDVEISYTGKKLSRSLEPEKYKVEIVPESTYVRIVSLKCKHFYNLYQCSYYDSPGHGLYATEKECKESWNRKIRDILDFLQSEYEITRDHILTKLYKKL